MRSRTAALAVTAVVLLLLGFSHIRHSTSPGRALANSPPSLRYSASNPLSFAYPGQHTRLFQQLLATLRQDEPPIQTATHDAHARLGRPEPTLEEEEEEDWHWLRGKTVLLMGDSIDRYHALHLCQFLSPSSPLIPVPWPHATPSDFISILSPSTSPSLYPSALTAQETHLSSTFTRLDGQPLGRGREPARSWVCNVPELDLVVMWGMIFGLDDGVSTPGVERGKGGTWGEKAMDLGMGGNAFWPLGTEHFHPPLAAEDRLQQLFEPLLVSLGRKSVDFVQVGVGAWDLDMFRTQDDMYHTRHSATLNQTVSQLASNPLSVERKAFVHTRLSSFLSSILLNWPLSTSQPSKVVLDPDNPPPSPPSMASLKSRLQIRTVPMTPQHYAHPWLTPASRINEYSILVESVAREVGVEVSPWAEVLEEAEEWGGGGKGGRWLDHIHPGPVPASALWIDMLLADLKDLHGA